MTKLEIFNSLTTEKYFWMHNRQKLIENELCNQVEDILATVTHVASRDFPWFWTHMYALLSARPHMTQHPQVRNETLCVTSYNVFTLPTMFSTFRETLCFNCRKSFCHSPACSISLQCIVLEFFPPYWYRVSCIQGWPQTYYVANGELEFLIILHPYPTCWNCRRVSPC